MSKVLIVGCGYIGQKLAQQLQNSAGQVLGFVRSQRSLESCKDKGIDCRILNLDEDQPELEPAIDWSKAIVLYLVPPQPSGQDDVRMRHFLHLINRQAPDKFILISTTGVYGDCAGNWVDETTPVKPRVDRAKRRYSAELQAQAFCDNLNIPLTILRVPGIYGPGKFPLDRIKKALPIVCGEDSPFSNRIHATDLVNICIKAVVDDEIKGVYNCADGHPTTMYDYFMQVAKAHNLPAPPAISLEQARTELSSGMLSYMEESRRISNVKLLRDFKLTLQYPDLDSGLADVTKD